MSNSPEIDCNCDSCVEKDGWTLICPTCKREYLKEGIEGHGDD